MKSITLFYNLDIFLSKIGAATTTSGGSLFDNLNTDSPSGYNPKYEGKMKRSGAESMFPNYHPTHENQKMQKSLRRHNISIANACTSLKNLAEEHCICIPCNKSKGDDAEVSPKRYVFDFKILVNIIILVRRKMHIYF